ncbi:amidase [Sphingomonas solaris]|uniref:Amidase n=1 Tax=Alterirhizorhabdus solaris TaxID=2529389 RepID=A0A558R8Q1_9SPHN|nr:amidase [Sphingomonas solaris]TVV75765.1 amidase [Sphingomonas solaris]
MTDTLREDEPKAAAGPAIGPRLASVASAPDDELSWQPAWRIRERIVARDLSPVEVTDHFLRRIETLDPVLHAFRQIDVDGARAQARHAEAALAAGEPAGALLGVPVAVKELISVGGMTYRDASTGMPTLRERDALEVERLRNAGAVIVGITVGGLTTREFGDTDRQPQNPWDRTRVCGDSSSGAACAQAAAMVPLSLAADGLGSTRLPAAYCGLVGMIATRGRIADTDWTHLVNRLLSQSGPLARDVRDAATMLSVMAGPDGRDLFCLPDSPPDYLDRLEDGANGMRLVWTDDFGYASTYAGAESARVIETVRHAAQRLAAAGAVVEETQQVFEDPNRACNMVMLSDPGLAIRQDLSREDVARTRETRGRIWRTFMQVLEGYDFILSPTIQHVAPTRQAWTAGWQAPTDWRTPSYMATYSAHTAAANLLGWPAISVPAGLVDGLPVGLQILGRPNSEVRMLQLAQAFLSLGG